MSNKPQTDPRYHDASDPKCVMRANAEHWGFKANPDRTCPACSTN
jgi:hypothetical protein